MNRTMRFARSPLSVRLARFATAALVIAGVAGCGHPQSGPAPTPSPSVAASKEVKPGTDMSPNLSIEEYLASRSAGVEIGHVNGTLTVRIRGASHSVGSNLPLYIVDGVPFTPSTDGGLSGINPYDVASIKALKDPADLAMYGVRGMNGVIVIKTKKAN